MIFYLESTFSFGEACSHSSSLKQYGFVNFKLSVKYYNVDMAAAIMAALPTLIGNIYISW